MTTTISEDNDDLADVWPPSADPDLNATWDVAPPLQLTSTNDTSHLKPSEDGVGLKCRGTGAAPGLSTFTIGTWNVTTLQHALDDEHLEQALKTYKYDAIALTETHGIGIENRLDGRLLLSGGTKHYAGVGILLSLKAKAALISHECISDRVMSARLSLKGPGSLVLVAAYAPTSTATNEVIDTFYEQLEGVIQRVKPSDTLVFAGDLNAKLGANRIDPLVIGPHSIGTINDRGLRLLDFCHAHQLTSANTWFRKRLLHKVTWISRAGNARNAIDHILVRQKHLQQLVDCRSYSAAFDTDHRLVLCNMKLQIKRTPKLAKPPPKPCANLLTSELAATIKAEVRVLVADTDELETITTAIHDAALKTCAPMRHNKSKPHITSETIDLIEKKRKAIGTPEYRLLKNQVRAACDNDLDNWLLKQADTINDAFHRNDSALLFKTAKGLTAGSRKPEATIKLSDGTPCDTPADEVQRWHEYAQVLFQSNLQRATYMPQQFASAPSPADVIKRAISRLKNGKAAGPDGVQAEFLKAMLDDPVVFSAIHRAINRIWTTGIWPSLARTSNYIALYKKGDNGDCGNYRTLALITHASKIMLNIIQEDLNRVAKITVSDTQYGFSAGKSTTDAIFTLKLIGQAHMAVGRRLHMVFVDFRKAFDSVIHHKLLEIIDAFGVMPEVTRLIANLYNGAHGSISWKGLTTDQFETPVGVRQGCPLSPVLFNLYTEVMMREWKERVSHLTPPDVAGDLFWEMRYADDLVLLARSADDATYMLEVLDSIATSYGLKLHPGETEHLALNPPANALVTLHGNPIKSTNHFKYLGCSINTTMDDSTEIRSRIAMAKSALNTCVYLKKPRICTETKLHLARALILSKMLYGASTWTVSVTSEKAIDAFGRTMGRKLLGIVWSDFVSNQELEQRIGDRWQLTQATLMNQQWAWLGHFHRHTNHTTLVNGQPTGSRRTPGRPRLRWVDGLRRWTGSTAATLVDEATARSPILPKKQSAISSMVLRSHSRQGACGV